MKVSIHKGPAFNKMGLLYFFTHFGVKNGDGFSIETDALWRLVLGVSARKVSLQTVRSHLHPPVRVNHDIQRLHTGTTITSIKKQDGQIYCNLCNCHLTAGLYCQRSPVKRLF